MSKSLFEPKKIVRYANSQEITEGGLGAAPTPVRQRTVSTGTPKLAQATPTPTTPSPVAPPAPTPQPAPPVPVGETRAFSFDGATELTGSFSTKGGSRLERGTLSFTARPGWGQADTGSFTVFSINNPSDHTDYKRSFEFRRTSGSGGYRDDIVIKFSKGSESREQRWRHPHSPNFYSGSAGYNYYQIYFSKESLVNYKLDKTTYQFDFMDPPIVTDTGVPITRANATKILLNSTDYSMNVGGLNSGSDNYYNGEIANLALVKGFKATHGSAMPRNIEDSVHVDIVYKFEGNTVATKGGQDLDVVGTETYVSSSI